MGKLTQVWLSDDNVPFETEAEMLAHEEITREVKLAKNYEAFLDYQVSGYEYEIHPESLEHIETKTIEMVIEHLQRHLKAREV